MNPRNLLRSHATFGALSLGLCVAAQAQSTTLAIQGSTVVDVTDGSLNPNQNVPVEGNRITAVGPAAEVNVPDDAEVVDGTGGYLIPGLWDMHGHAEGGGQGLVGTYFRLLFAKYSRSAALRG